MPGLTAWHGLFDHGRLQAGQSVLAHGAAGSVGSMVTQLVREAGAYVIVRGAPRAPRARAVSLSRRRRRPPRRDQRTRGAIDDRDDRESDPGGRLLPGNAEPAAQAPGVISTALATPAATSPTPPIATTARTPRRSRSSSPPSGSLRTRVLARTPTQLTLLRLGDLGRLTSHDSNVRAVMKLRLTAANVSPRAGNSRRPATRLPGRAGS